MPPKSQTVVALEWHCLQISWPWRCTYLDRQYNAVETVGIWPEWRKLPNVSQPASLNWRFQCQATTLAFIRSMSNSLLREQFSCCTVWGQHRTELAEWTVWVDTPPSPPVHPGVLWITRNSKAHVLGTARRSSEVHTVQCRNRTDFLWILPLFPSMVRYVP